MKITHNTSLNMVIGYPLHHTQSPLLHQAVYQMLGVDAVLLAKSHPSLDALIQAIKTLSVPLTAVTSPYKEKILKYIDVCSPEVAVLKAANTLIQRDGQLYGFNTDVDGIAFALREHSMHYKNVLVIGAGGASRAMAYFLKKQQANIYWLNRTKAKAEQLAYEFGGNVMTQTDLNKYEFQMIVNTTSLGVYPNLHESPLPHHAFHAGQIVFDMVYNPVRTAFLKDAENADATIISGIDMFIGQGLKQIELFTGKKYALEGMDALRQLLILNQ